MSDRWAKTVNGVPVIGTERVPWQRDDDPEVGQLVDSRGVVYFEGGGKSDAVVISNRAIIWERDGARFRSFPVASAPAVRFTRTGVDGRLWSCAVPGGTVGESVRIEWDEMAAPDNSCGAAVCVTGSGLELRVSMTKRELRRLFGVAAHWPGMEMVK